MASTLNLYLISQTENNEYDTYSEAVVAAANKHEAQGIHPNGRHDIGSSNWADGTWTKNRVDIKVKEDRRG